MSSVIFGPGVIEDQEISNNGHHVSYESTASSAVLRLKGPVKVKNLKVVNSFDYPNQAHLGPQAVAVLLFGHSQVSLFENCTFESYQDTLYLEGGNSVFNHCTITGCVDFIFGSGNATFNDCTIISNKEGCVCAPSTWIGQEGFVFNSCKFEHRINVQNKSVKLARPWHPGARPFRFPRAEFNDCSFGPHIDLQSPWDNMKDTFGLERSYKDACFTIN